MFSTEICAPATSVIPKMTQIAARGRCKHLALLGPVRNRDGLEVILFLLGSMLESILENPDDSGTLCMLESILEQPDDSGALGMLVSMIITDP